MHFLFVATNKNKNLFRRDPSFIYRCENMAKGLEEKGHTTQLIHLKELTPFMNADVIIFHRPSFSIRLWVNVKLFSLKNIFIMMDVDDFIFDESYAKESPAYINNILPLQKVKNQFQDNLRAFKLFSNFSVSTKPLKSHLRRLTSNSNIVVIPNAVFYSWKNSMRHKGDLNKKIISYFPGTRSHDKDFEHIHKPLEVFLNKYPEVLLKITGEINLSIDIKDEQIFYNTKVPFIEHSKNYQNIWVNLAPLQDSEFNACKSALKVIEAGYFNIPTLCAVNDDNERFIGSGALMVSTENEIFEQLEIMMDPKRYKSVVKNLQERIMLRANVKKTSQKLIDFLEYIEPIRFAKDRRKRGLYDKKTLKLYQRSWKMTEKPDTFIAYCMFCRDLGYSLSEVRVKKLKNIYHMLRSKKHADALLNEYHHTFMKKDLYLEQIFHRQVDWIDEFQFYIKNQKICIVGNAASIKNKKLGHEIDNFDIVIRFNNCCQDENKNDLGKKRDIWVSAPDIKSVIQTKWIIVSGPNMIYRGANWHRFFKLDLNKNKIMSVPLDVWKEMVSLLNAPPSAGILLLYWIKTIKKGFHDISIVGFDLKFNTMQYHYSDANHKPGKRHNWVKEKELLKIWLDDGLRQII